MFNFSTYREKVNVNFHSPILSISTFFNFLIWALCIILPYIIAYQTHGFWTKISYVREQPLVRFKHEAIVILNLIDEKSISSGQNSNYVWSTFDNLNQLVTNYDIQIPPLIQSRENDENLDGIYEYLDLELKFKVENSTKVVGVQVLLFFDYKLSKHTTTSLEGLAFTSYNSGSLGNSFSLISDLDFIYRHPLTNTGRHEFYSKSILNENSTDPSDYDLVKILKDYSLRNLSTTLSNKVEILRNDGKLGARDFCAKLHINYKEVSYECRAGFWETMKWAWIQYLGILVIIWTLLKKFQSMVYAARLFEYDVEKPWESRVHLTFSINKNNSFEK